LQKTHHDSEYKKDETQNIYVDGLDTDWAELEPNTQGRLAEQAPQPPQNTVDLTHAPGTQPLPCGPLKGYKYT